MWLYSMNRKRKLIINIREDLLEEARHYVYGMNKSLEEVIEEYLEYLVLTKWIDALAKDLGLDGLEPISESEIPQSRPAGLDASKAVRELREGRAEALFCEAG